VLHFVLGDTPFDPCAIDSGMAQALQLFHTLPITSRKPLIYVFAVLFLFFSLAMSYEETEQEVLLHVGGLLAHHTALNMEDQGDLILGSPSPRKLPSPPLTWSLFWV
jgi:hypothetical protein